MSAGLKVSVTLLTYEPDLAVGSSIVGDIYPASGSGVAQRNVVIPCGASVEPRRFEVAPGRYVVSARLPSGEVLSEDVEAREGADITVSLDASDSPHETHSWQYLLGNIESGSLYRRTLTRPIPYPPVARGANAGVYDRKRYITDPTDDYGILMVPSPAVTWIGDSKDVTWAFESILELITRPAAAAVAEVIANSYPAVPLDPHQGDGTSHLYHFDESGPIGSPSPDPSAHQLLLVEMDDAGYLMRLPTRWRSAVVEVLVDGRRNPAGSAVSVTVRDPAVGAGLAYMARGALNSAARLFTDVESMLYSKVSNPLAAAAGAYVLVGTDLSDEPRRWDSWLENLRSWFEWMSDGSILWAVRRLRLARTEDDLRLAREALIEAYDRGVPYFTLGLSWLINGLSDFPDDPECARRLEQVRRLSWSVDMREPFVIVALGRGAAS